MTLACSFVSRANRGHQPFFFISGRHKSKYAACLLAALVVDVTGSAATKAFLNPKPVWAQACLGVFGVNVHSPRGCTMQSNVESRHD